MSKSQSQSSDRSTKGCWTCRVRHRKCDESLPACTECTHRHIPCHGYGPKPAWVEDPSELHEELQRIRNIVKSNFRRNKLKSARGRLSDPGVSLSSGNQEAPSAPSKTLTSNGNVQSTFREAQLLVHYLDYIFPIQYPYYVDNPDLGGRGWLFWLLTKDGPLRQAALTLSALHKQTESRDSTENAEEELLRYHTKAMQELRQVLGRHEENGFAHSREQWIEFIACGTALISFEVFQGGKSNWEPHLNALTSIIGQMNTVDIETDRDKRASAADFTTPAWRFLMCNLLWFDLLSCASTETPPRLPYREWLDSEGMDISCVMGCRNWAMIAIGDTGTLRAKIGVLDVEELRCQAEAIAKRLWNGIDSLKSSSEPTLQPISQYVTRVFAMATLIQLQAIAPGRHSLTMDIQKSVEGVIRAIKDVPEGISLRGLAWPICIAGSMAQPDQQPFFENLMGNISGKSGLRYSNCGTVLRVMRHCWTRPDSECMSGSDTIWTRAMAEMGICALLV